MDSTRSRPDWTSGTLAVTTALGVLTVALFPLAVPFVILTIVATVPLVAALAVPLAFGAIIAGVWVLVRAIGRGLRRVRGDRASESLGARVPRAHPPTAAGLDQPAESPPSA